MRDNPYTSTSTSAHGNQLRLRGLVPWILGVTGFCFRLTAMHFSHPLTNATLADAFNIASLVTLLCLIVCFLFFHRSVSTVGLIVLNLLLQLLIV